jgi:ABC-type lipoprotein export system ATPase subunit
LGDEPTGQLDQQNSKKIMQYFRKVTTESSTAMIIVTHDVSVAKQCSKVYFLRDGKLVKVKAKSSQQ